MADVLTGGDKLEDGHYTVIEEVGVGGMGVVYRCRDELLLRDVAIKMLLPELTTNRKNHEIFWQEARLAAQLEHPNVVTIYDIGVEERDGKPHHYLAMEYLPGGNLANKLAKGALPVEHCLNWMKQLAAGLGFAHKRGVIHQDIKADNIFITKGGDLKIGDFGLAKLLVGRVHYNSSNKGLGTPAYMSPELCRGEPQDHRSDIYSLGVLFFEMATGQLPFHASGMIEMAMKHSNAPIPSVRRLNPQAPEALDRMIRKMMFKTPDGRYQTTIDILNVLEELIFEMRANSRGLTTTPHGDQSATRKKSPAAKMVDDDELDEQASRRAKPASNTPYQRISGAKPTEFLSVKGLAALDLRWTFRSNGPIGWSSSPSIDQPERILYVASADSYLYALEAESGAKLWAYCTGAPIVTSAVLLDDKVIIAGANGTISAISAKEGTVLWNLKLKRMVVATPAIHEEVMVVAGFDGIVQGIELANGVPRWECECREAISGSPEQAGEQIFFGTQGGAFYALNAQSGDHIWQFQADGAIISGCTVSAGTVYFGSKTGTYYALSANTGNLLWQNTTEHAVTSKGAVFVDAVLFANRNKALYCCERDSGSLLWRSSLRGTTLATPVICGEAVLTATREGWLQSFALDTGEVNWQRELGRCLESTPLATASMLFVPTVEGDVLAYAFTQAGLSAQSLSA